MTRLPLVVNRRHGEAVPELTEDICLLVENTVDGYRAALESLLGDDQLREQLGRAGRERSSEVWSAERAEAKLAAVHRRDALSSVT